MAPSASLTKLEVMRAKISSAFDQAQLSTANHRKNCVALYQCQLGTLCGVHRSRKDKTAIDVHDPFCGAFIEMVDRLLTVNKGTPNATRVVQFITAYVQFALQKECTTKPDSSAHHTTRLRAENENSTAAQLVEQLVRHLSPGFESKDRVVRYRCINIVSELLLRVNELQNKIWRTVGGHIVQRIQDKEPSIRVQAILTLCTLLASGDAFADDKGTTVILGTILESLCNDPSPDVRRTALLHLSLTARTLPYILTRSRDIDAGVRTTVFSIFLPHTTRNKCRAGRGCSLIDIRTLTLTQRERLVRDGLGDREEKVCAATAQMLGAWFDALADEARDDADDETKEQDSATESMIASVAAFIRLFDYVSLDGDSTAPDALKSLFRSRPKVFRSISLSEEHWASLSLEAVLLVRVLIEYTIAKDGAASALDVIGVPEVVAFSFFVQEACNAMLDAIENLETARATRDEDVDEFAQIEDPSQIEQLEGEVVDTAFVVSELLKIAAGLDYSDEIGRRKMFSVIREMLIHEFLPECLIEPCMEVFRQVAPNEKEFVRIIVEIIDALRTGVSENVGSEFASKRVHSQETMSDATQSIVPGNDEEMTLGLEVLAQVDEMELRCLRICAAMLERSNGVLQENSVLHGLLSSLIIPSVKREEMLFRERGLISLGLMSLLSEDLAKSTFQLFVNQVHCTPEDLKLNVLRVIFDLLMMHPGALLRHSAEKTELIITFLLQTLEYDDSPSVQATICIGLSKLLLNGFLYDERVLSVLVLSYASPATAENQMLRQCLAYFFPAYSHSSSTNQKRMQSIFLTVFKVLLTIQDGEEEGMVTPLSFASEFLDWLDPDKVADQTNSEGRGDVQLELACDIVTILYDKADVVGGYKVFTQVLSKLKLPNGANTSLLNRLNILLEGILQNRPLEDLTAQRTVQKFATRFRKLYTSQMDAIDATQLQDDPLFATACELAGINHQDSDQSDSEDEDEDEEDAEHVGRRDLSPMKPSSKRRPSISDEEISSDADDASSASERSSALPTKNTGGRRADASRSPPKKRYRPIVISDSDQSS